MKSGDLELLTKCLKIKEEVEDVLKSNAHGKNPFSMQWHDTKETRGMPFDQSVCDEWNAQKVKLANTFLKLVKKQIAIEKKRIKIKEG